MKERVIMSKKEIDRIGVLETILNKKMSQVDGAKILRVSDRQMRRMIKRVREKGVQSIVHQNRGQPSPKKIRSKISTKICDLYKEKYHDFGPTFALEKLQEHHGISISRESLRQILIKDGLWRIRQGRKGTVHTWRERKHYEGEMVQIDGSHHRWLEDRLDQEFCLMAYIDDATGKVYARFYEYEGVFPALDSFQRFVNKNGCPKTIYIDRHSTYKTTRKATLDEDLEGCGSNTQFQQVMKNIDVRVIHARSPQAKGRVERLFETLQDRLVKELRLKGISTIHAANVFLKTYLPIFNKKFSVPAKKQCLLYQPLPTCLNPKWVFCLRTNRRIAKNYTIQVFNRLFLIKHPHLSLRKQMVCVKQALNGDLQFETKHKILSVKEITERDVTLVQKAQKKLIKQLQKHPEYYKSKKTWLDQHYVGKRHVHLVT